MKTVSLEIAKQLHEAEFPQESFLCWFEFKHGWDLAPTATMLTEVRRIRSGYVGKEIIQAPTADEILDELPEYVDNRYMSIWKEDGVWFFEYDEHTEIPIIKGNCLVDACAKMWLYLKKEGLL
mgnify:CR=1 FL=1